MESIEARFTALKSEVQELILGDGGLSDLIKMILDVGTTIVKFANSDIGEAIIKLSALAGVIKVVNIAFKTLAATKIGGDILTFFSMLGNASAYGGVLKVLTLIPTIVPYVAIFAVALGGIYAMATANERKLQNINDKLKDNNDKIKDISDEVTALESKTTDLNKAEKNRLKYLKAQSDVLKSQNKEYLKRRSEITVDQYKYTDTSTGTTQGGTFLGGSAIDNEKVYKGAKAIGQVTNKLKELNNAYKQGNITQSDYINSSQELVYSLDGVFQGYQDIIDSGGTLNETDQQIYDTIIALNNAFEANGGKSNLVLTAQQQLQNAFNNSIPVMDNFKTLLVAEGDTYQWVSKQAKNNAIAVLETEVQKTKAVIANAKTRMNMFSAEAEAQAALSGISAGVDIMSGKSDPLGLGDKTSKQYNDAQKRLKELRAAIKKANQYSIVPSTLVGGGDSSGDTSGSSKEKDYSKGIAVLDKYIAKQLESYQRGEKSADQYYDALQKKAWSFYKAGKISYDDYTKYIEQGIKDIFDELESDYDRGVITAKQYNDEVIAQSKKFYNKGKLTYAEYRDYLLKGDKALKQSAIDVAQTRVDKSNALLDALNLYAQEQQDAIDKNIAKLQEQLDLLDDTNNATEKAIELEKLQNALASAKKNKVRIYSEALGWHWAEEANAVKEAQANLDAFNREQELQKSKKTIQAKIDLYEKEKKAWSDLVSDFSAKQQRMELELELGTTIEKAIFGTRAQTIENYKQIYTSAINEMIAAQKALAEAQQMAEEPLVQTGTTSILGASYQYTTDMTSAQIKAAAVQANIDKRKAEGYSVTPKYNESGQLTGYRAKDTGNVKDGASKLIPVKKNASGTSSLPSSSLSQVNEMGDELIIPPVTKGDIGYFQKGTGIIPANLTKNLMDIGRYGLQGLKSYITTSKTGNTDNSTNLSIASVNVTTNNANDFVRQLKNLAIVNK